MEFLSSQPLPERLESNAPVIELAMRFLEDGGAVVGAPGKEDREPRASFYLSKNGATVFTGRTTVDALLSPVELVSEALSFLNHADPVAMEYLIGQLSYCAGKAAEVADCNGWGFQLTADICLRPMKTAVYKGGGQFREATCAICLDDFKEGDWVAGMPCSHVFHGLCISRWFRRSHLCPLCRSACYEEHM